MKKLLTAAATAIAMLSASPAMADPWSLTWDGVTFTVDQIDGDSLTLRIQNALSTTGGWAAATHIDNIALKGLGGTFTNGSISSGAWVFSSNELNANGCLGGASGGVCFDAAPPVALSNDITFTIDLVGGPLNISATTGPHLKIRFLDSVTGTQKVGSLLSQDLDGSGCTSNCGGDDDDTNVPEPASLALVGLGLVGMSLVRRRRAQLAAA